MGHSAREWVVESPWALSRVTFPLPPSTHIRPPASKILKFEMASIFILLSSTDPKVRAFDTLDAIADLPDVLCVKEMSGGHAIASMRDGNVFPIRRVMLERGAGTSPDVFSPPPPVCRTDSALSHSAAGLADEDGTSPSLAGRVSPLFFAPAEFCLRTPERKHNGGPCPGAPARVMRVSPKRFRGSWGVDGSAIADIFHSEHADSAVSRGKPEASSAASGAGSSAQGAV